MSTSQAEVAAYTETVDCTRRDAEGAHDYDHGGECDYRPVCGICWQVVEDGPCPAHAPPPPPGIVRIECDAQPPHVTFAYAFDGYPPPCPWCQWHAAEERHRGCAHSHHGRWRSWKLTGRVEYLGARLGLWGGLAAVTYGGGCDGCRTGFRWGGRWSFLFARTEQWRLAWTRLRHPSRRLMCPECATGWCGSATCAPADCSCPSCGLVTAETT